VPRPNTNIFANCGESIITCKDYQPSESGSPKNCQRPGGVQHGRKLVINTTGHVPSYEQPETFNAALLEFIGGL